MRNYLYYVQKVRNKPYTPQAFQDGFEDYQRHFIPRVYLELGTEKDGQVCSFTEALPDTQFFHFEPCPLQYQKVKSQKSEIIDLYQQCIREKDVQMSALCFHDKDPYKIDRLNLYYGDEKANFGLEGITNKQSKHVLDCMNIEEFLRKKKFLDRSKTIKINSRRLTHHFIHGWPKYLSNVQSLVIQCDDSGRQAYTADYFIDRLFQLDFKPTALCQIEAERTAIHFVPDNKKEERIYQ